MSSESRTSFKLLSKISKEEDSSCVIPVKKYISENTGMRLYVCHVDGPVIEGYFSLATEATDDDGLPHTLEHMIFLGSEDYPYSGILDILANKIYAAGTNAWTDVDNTTYTISTVEKQGFLQLLPIYLDHIFYPLLKESGFITEVYHINGDGEDAGVVYSEMQSVENEDETVVERAVHRAMFPDPSCGYRYETGGMLENLRSSCSHKKVCDYHDKMYRPDNMAVIIAGKIEDEDVIEVLEKFEKKILSKNPERIRLSERPFSNPVSCLNENIIETVYFPCDEEKNTNGIVSLAYRGPDITDIRLMISLDLLFYYLVDSSISPVQSHFISKNSYCNKISYKVEDYKKSFLSINFLNVQLEHIDKIKPDFDTILDDMVQKRVPLDMNRMSNIIKMKICDINDKFEDSPQVTISHICIGDFLYGSLENQNEFRRRFCQAETFESLRSENSEYWLDLIDKYLVKANFVAITGKPCEKLMKSIGEEDRLRVEERKKKYGKKGLKDLKMKAENAISENDDFDIPDEIYDQLKVPSLENVKLRQIIQSHSYDDFSNKEKFLPIENYFKNFSNLKHLQMQVDHLEGTNFVQLHTILDTTKLSNHLRPYLQLYTSLLFESPIKNDLVDMTHDQVVYGLNKDLLEFDTSIGLDGSEFEPGIFPQYLSIFTKTPVSDYELAIRWSKFLLFDIVFDKKQINIAISNLLKEIKKRKQQPFDIIQSLVRDLYFQPESNICLNAFMRQESFLKEAQEQLFKSDEIESKLNKLRNELLQDGQIRFYLCADLNKLSDIRKSELDKALLEYFPPTLTHNQNLVFKSNAPFKVDLTWKLKKTKNESLNDAQVFTLFPQKDFIVNLGSSESSFLHVISSTDINSYHHPNYASLLVLIEYFCQTEGPLWEAVRGPGFCYHQSININPEKAVIELSLDECSHVTKAYQATRKIFNQHLTNKNEFEANLLESAKNSLIFLLIDELKSVSNYSAYSMSCLFKGVDINAVKNLIKEIEKVEMKDLKKLLKSYIMPLFDDDFSNCIIVCHPAKSEPVIQEFSEKFDRKLNVIGKVEECLCSI